MDDLWARGQERWPHIDLSRDSLTRHVERLERPGTHADLYLACACVQQHPLAHEAFEREVLAEVPSFIARIDSTSSFADEVRQVLRERLLVARPGHLARLAEYSGQGPLGAWVRVAAVRVALDLRAKERGNGTTRELPEEPALSEQCDPELALIKERYQGDYQNALREALAALSPKEKNLLRMHVVDGLSVDRIGVAYQVHRATAARWVVAVRQRLLEETYRLLGERLRLTPAELDSLAVLVQSQLHLSLSRLLPTETHS